jgi:hypothetical protein
LHGPGCSFFSRSRAAQSPSMLFNIRSSSLGRRRRHACSLELLDLAALAVDLNAHTLDLVALRFHHHAGWIGQY